MSQHSNNRVRRDSRDQSLRSVVSVPISVTDSTNKGRTSFPMQSGTILGLDKFFMRSPDIWIRKFVVC